jgi:hypothetical protein
MGALEVGVRFLRTRLLALFVRGATTRLDRRRTEEVRVLNRHFLLTTDPDIES